uniref:Uncharacterized protein n=1 Tax=Tetranychus urticae TaxID=32264 RepID=T1KZ17_TETUR
MDDLSAEIRVSAWNLPPEDLNPFIGSIIVVRRAKMTHKPYGRLLTVSGCSSVEINPAIPEVTRLAECEISQLVRYAKIPILVDQLFLTLRVFDDSGSISLIAFTNTALELLKKEISDIPLLEER